MVLSRRLILIFVLSLPLLLFGCSSSNSDIIPGYSLTITIEPEEAGTVVKEPDQSTYRKGTEVTLTAAPNQGWFFQEWKGDLTDTTNPVVVIIEQDTNIIASFSDNQSPVLETIGNQTAAEQSQLSFEVTASDPDGDQLTYSASGDTAPVSGDLAQFFDPATRTFTWTPASGDTGSYSLTFTVEDGRGGTDQETISISVGEAAVEPNNPPVIGQLADQQTEEEIALSFTLTATDPEQDTLTYTASGDFAPSSGSLDQYFNPATQTFNWTPARGEAGSYTLTIQVSDGQNTVEKTVIISVGINFTDPVLEQHVRNNIGITEGVILPADVTGLQVFSAVGDTGDSASDITSLVGLEYFTGLQQLFLNDNTIEDLTPLAGLIDLMVLNLANNNISDLIPLASLSLLQELDLSDNNFSDLSPLVGLTYLRVLNAASCFFLSDLSPLTTFDLSNLQVLKLNTCSILDLTPLAGLDLSSLQELDLSQNFQGTIWLTDISPLANPSLISLQRLNLGLNSITDISSLSHLTNLTSLQLAGNQINDLSILTGTNFPYLAILDLGSNGISDLTHFSAADLPPLTNLTLGGNNISDLSPFNTANLPDLTVLYLYSNSITNITPLSNFPGLQTLLLNNNQLTDIQILLELNALSLVNIENNGLTITADPPSTAYQVIQQLESRVPPVTVNYTPQ